MPFISRRLLFASALFLCTEIAAAAGPLIVVGHADVPPLDEATLQRIYLGKVVEVDGRPVIPVNLQRGNSLRRAFMERFLNQDDEKFIAYWTVRRYIGQGTPPREFASAEDQMRFVRETPGAIGYSDDPAKIGDGVRPLLTRQ